jgi:hypothetical protein
MSVEKKSPSQVSRRTIAKGAAWTLPVVATGVSAPAFAASLPPCTQAKMTVSRVNCTLVGLNTPPYFRVCNPTGSGCQLPVGYQFTLTTSGLLGYDVDLITGSSGAQLLYVVGNTYTFALTQSLQPGQCRDIKFLQQSWLSSAVNLQQVVTLNVNGVSSTISWTYICTFGICLFICV